MMPKRTAELLAPLDKEEWEALVNELNERFEEVVAAHDGPWSDKFVDATNNLRATVNAMGDYAQARRNGLIRAEG